MEQKDISRAQELIGHAQKIIVSTHRSPDGDAIGSSLAMAAYLRKLNKAVTVVVPDAFPAFLNWMKGSDAVLNFESDPERVKAEMAEADLIFSLDYNELSRTGDLAETLASAKSDFILIDHHQQPGDFASVRVSDTSVCSTAQMVFEFIEASGHLNLIDAEIGSDLYCGIMTDTGSFRFSSVTPRTHEIAASLIRLGVNHAEIHQAVYDTNALSKLQLMGYVLSEKLKVIDELHTAYIVISDSELSKYNYRKGDTEGLVNFALSINGIRFAAFLREGNKGTRMSFRSKGDFDVNQFARSEFNGGGHINAAGGYSDAPLLEVEQLFLTSLNKYTDLLK